jgi:tRNA pseudouridine55 synthase
MATGVLPLVLGHATRLAKFMSAGDKAYDAVVRFGMATDTGDAVGAQVGTVSTGPWPTREAIDVALDAFRGTFLQQPPAFSARRIDGTRSYKLARSARLKPGATALSDPPAPPALLAPSQVTVHRLEVVSVDADRVTLNVDCSAGFYVRSLAHDLGARLGIGAHLVALRRTRSGDFGLNTALALDDAERDPERAMRHIIAPAQMLPGVPAVVLTGEGVRRARNGRDLGPADVERAERSAAPSLVRLLDTAGDLVGIGRPATAQGLLHPFVVLG